MITPGTPDNPLRVAIIGSGPSGFYAVEHLQKQDLVIETDLFDRLPTPYGLVRGGVAPDHPKIKSVTRVYDKIAAHPSFRFYGHVEFGTDLTLEDIARHYHAVIFATGAQTDKRLDIPGEDLPGSHPATEFVAWYNGHPDFRHLEFDLSQESVAVVGIGNVAMDVARILARSVDELRATDIADYALEALSRSRVRDIYILGRRGPVQAAFTNPEIKEMGEMAIAEPVVAPDEVRLDPLSQVIIDRGEDKVAIKNLETLVRYANTAPTGKPRRIIFKFLVSPTELIGTDRVEAVRLVRNSLVDDGRGGLKARATDQFETIPAGLVFRSVGYRGVALPGVPFHEPWGTIPNDRGRVLTRLNDGEPVIGEYVAGWIKRGPTGIIGTNKPDAVETVDALLEDVRAGRLFTPTDPSREAIDRLLCDRGVEVVSYEDWLTLDRMEIERGAAVGRPRLKFCDVDEMLSVVSANKAALPGIGND